MNKKLLNNILHFLNKVPNREYGDNYQLASELSIYIMEQDLLLAETKRVLKTLKTDAKWALKGKWVPEGEGMDGFECQITLINELLTKLKEFKNDTGK